MTLLDLSAAIDKAARGIDYLDNRDGSGWLKVTTGHGSPAYGSRHLAIEDGSFVPTEATS